MGKGVSRKAIEKTVETVAKHKAVTIALVLIPLLLALIFRLYPVSLPATDNWAEQSVQDQIVAQYEQQLRAQYPTLPQQQLRQRAIQEYRTFRAQNPAEFEAQEQQLSQAFKQRLQITLETTDGEGKYEQTYPLAIDPYFYLRRADNLIETGATCDEIIDGTCMDTFKLAPEGRPTRTEGHDFMSAFAGKVATWFGYQPITGFFYLPAILVALSTLPAFFIAYRRYGAIAGFTAAMIVALHPTLLGRTPAGFSDTDAYNSLFPLLITLLFLFAYDSKGYTRYLLMAAAALFTGIYSWFWQGWYFTFFLLLLVSIAVTIFFAIRQYLNKKKKNTDAQTSLLTALTYFVTTALFTTLISGWDKFQRALLNPVSQSFGLQNPIKDSLWPNVFTTVAELNTQSLPGIIRSTGGEFLFILATMGALIFALNPKKMTGKDWGIIAAAALYYTIVVGSLLTINKYVWFALYALPFIALTLYMLKTGEGESVHYGIFAVGWLIASVFATTQGTRFSLLILPVFAISIAFLIGWMLRAVPRELKKHIELPELYGKALIILFAILLLVTPLGGNYISNADTIGLNEVPSMNDAWYESLSAITENSSEDAIITSWWDFGHWFKYVADRRVTFDGSSQNTPNAHWVGKLLQTDDEQQSVAILRMLHCGQNQAFDNLFEVEQNTLTAYNTVIELLALNEAEARDLLSQRGYDETLIQNVANAMYCTPPEAYLITSQDMIGKAGVWAHFGLWDFDRAYIYGQYQAEPEAVAITNIAQELGIEQIEAQQLYTQVASLPGRQEVNAWISPYPGYSNTASCSREQTQITCNLGLQVAQQQGVPIIANQLLVDTNNPENATITLVAQGQVVGATIPTTLYLDGEKYTNTAGDFALSIRIDDNRVIIAQDPLVNSLFTELFYRENEGQYFETLIETQQITGGKIIVYKVDWQTYLEDY